MTTVGNREQRSVVTSVPIRRLFSTNDFEESEATLASNPSNSVLNNRTGQKRRYMNGLLHGKIVVLRGWSSGISMAMIPNDQISLHQTLLPCQPSQGAETSKKWNLNDETDKNIDAFWFHQWKGNISSMKSKYINVFVRPVLSYEMPFCLVFFA